MTSILNGVMMLRRKWRNNMASKFLIKNAKAIVTCDENDHVYKDADILIEGPKITAIGRGIEGEGAQVIDGQESLYTLG